MVELVRCGRTPEELAREFEPTAQSIASWARQAERDAGKRGDGVTGAERRNLSGFVARTSAFARSAISCQKRRPLARLWRALLCRRIGRRPMVRAGEQGEPERVFRFMSAHQAICPIKTMARVFKISASGYYAWRGRPASARATADLDLMRKIRTIHAISRETYGAPRIHAELKAEGVGIGKKRVARLMRAAGLVGVSRRRSVTTTKRDLEHRPANDLVRRSFYVDNPNELWVADITFVPTLAGC